MTGFDLDIRFPDDLASGTKSFPIWATDAQGRTASTTATIELLPK